MAILNYDVIVLLPIKMLLMKMMVFCMVIEMYDYNDIALRAPHVEIKCFYLMKVIIIWWL
jgi:hypothetical protein